MYYEIDEENAVRIFTVGEERPVIYQPTWPNGDNWENAEEAGFWAQAHINSIVDENARLAPPSRNINGARKMTAEEKEYVKGLTDQINASTSLEEIHQLKQELATFQNSLRD